MKYLAKLQRDVLAVVWLAAGLFLALALGSFEPGDPSFNTKTTKLVAIKNLCGYVGSFISDLLYQSFGLSSWVLVLFCLAMAFVYIFQKDFQPNWAKRLLSLALLAISAALLSLHFPNAVFFNGEIPAGGIAGYFIHQTAAAVFNRVGAGVILWAAALALILVISERSLLAIIRSPWVTAKGYIYQIARRLSAAAYKRFRTMLSKAKPVTLSAISIATETASPVARFPVQESTDELKPLRERLINVVRDINPKLPSVKNRQLRIENWELPSAELLNVSARENRKFDERELQRNARVVEQKLAEFDVTGEVVEVKPGPAVTMYEFRPAASVKINDITKLSDDLSLALSAESLRIIAPIPGRDVVGIETSNSKRVPISMRELVEDSAFWSSDFKLPIALGKNVSGDPTIIDLRKIPHLLVAGTTGSGKSVFITALVTSMIMRHSPKTLRLVLIDPKQVDLAAFHKIPHLLMPPIKDTRGAVSTLKWLIKEMEKRYRSMSRFNSRNLEGFNEAVSALDASQLSEHESRTRDLEGNPQTVLESYYYQPQPYIVAVIEEFADLMSVDRSGVEQAVVRLAQMARASGIHLVVAMQSPRREVLTGLIKTNFPGRISFKVASKVDSSIILDQRGAERLLSVGDMLYLAPGLSQPQRYHGAFLKDEEISRISEFWMNQGAPEYETSAVSFVEDEDGVGGAGGLDVDKEDGYDEVVAYTSSQKEISASLIQRRFRFGYPKAARIIEMMESEGVIGPANGSKPRVVLINRLD